jgi:hypothetical protein
MNIFMLDADPIQAAQYMVDKHVVKMILESAQLLSTAHRILDHQVIRTYVPDGKTRSRTEYIMNDGRDDVLYQATHINHPCAIWTRESVSNYLWLADHFFGLCEEYTRRYGKRHKCYDMGLLLQSPPKNLVEWESTMPPCAMPEDYVVPGDPVASYRNYYRYGKKHLFSWTNRDIPTWILNE